MLIKCPECGKEISDKSKQCIYCGFPLEEQEQTNDDICIVNGVPVDLSFVLKEYNNGNLLDATRASILRRIRNYANLEKPSELYYKIIGDMKVPKYFNGEPVRQQSNTGTPIGTVKCPYCNSMNVKKINGIDRAASTGFFSLGSKKIGKQWHCNTCKSDF